MHVQSGATFIVMLSEIARFWAQHNEGAGGLARWGPTLVFCVDTQGVDIRCRVIIPPAPEAVLNFGGHVPLFSGVAYPPRAIWPFEARVFICFPALHPWCIRLFGWHLVRSAF